LKQSKLRKRRVIRFAILYFLALIIFVALIAGPAVIGKLKIKLPSIPMQLMQPTGQNNNDTTTGYTGSALISLPGMTGGAAATSGGSSAAATSSASSTA